MDETTSGAITPGAPVSVFDRADFPRLLEALAARGYRIIGPTVRGGAVVLDELTSAAELPEGYTDEQKPGGYRLTKQAAPALFGFSAGPHSWKKFLFPPRFELWRAARSGGALRIEAAPPPAVPTAFVGVRACELAAIRIQDRVLDGNDPAYSAVRRNVLIVAVTCARPGGTCFCASLGTGPEPGDGFDLCLTEIVNETRHVFLVRAGTENGRSLLGEIPHAPAAPADLEAAEALRRDVRLRMGRHLDMNGLREILYRSYEHPHWSEIAERCLTCANCTLVCPTCFCHTIEDTTDLTGNHAVRSRVWDSCFTTAFSRVAGGNTRLSTRARYRQWMMHKFATWVDQFGTPGCVGCGRCITWCPAAIDMTEEAAFFRTSESAESSPGPGEPAYPQEFETRDAGESSNAPGEPAVVAEAQ